LTPQLLAHPKLELHRSDVVAIRHLASLGFDTIGKGLTSMVKELLAALNEGRPVRVNSLAEALSVSRNGFYEAIKRGEIRSIRIGRSIRIPAQEARRVLGVDA
jgi:excisionase family DNA binding protein